MSERTTVRTGDKMIGDEHPCYLIAEISINHNGSMEIIKKLIDVALPPGKESMESENFVG